MIDRLDHCVLTVRSLDATCAFSARVLGLECVDAPGKPTGLRFGDQKINVHAVDRAFESKAATPTPGAGDFCLITARPIAAVVPASPSAACQWSSGRWRARARSAR